MDDIWLYSEDHWDEHQADRYLAGIYAAISDPEKRHVSGRSLPHVKAGVHRLRYVRHYIYFYHRDANIYVERVLHDSMDQTLHIL